MSSMFRKNIEKDFEFFVKNITNLEPVEFCGLARVLSVPTLRGLHEIGVTADELKNKTPEELEEIQIKLTIPAEDVLEGMMDRFLELPLRRRKEINQILKDIKRGR